MNFDPLGPLHAQPRLVTFMTDFGLRDPSAGVLSGVVLGIAPEARTLDLTHAIPPYDVEAGAEALVARPPPRLQALSLPGACAPPLQVDKADRIQLPVY